MWSFPGGYFGKTCLLDIKNLSCEWRAMVHDLYENKLRFFQSGVKSYSYTDTPIHPWKVKSTRHSTKLVSTLFSAKLACLFQQHPPPNCRIIRPFQMEPKRWYWMQGPIFGPHIVSLWTSGGCGCLSHSVVGQGEASGWVLGNEVKELMEASNWELLVGSYP